jgi:hypothetical protein
VNPFGAAGVQHSADVFDEHGPCAGLDDNPPGGGPKVAVVVGAARGSGLAMRLARDTAKYEVHASTKASARDGSGIAP